MVGRCCSFCDPDRQLPGTVPTGVETGLAAIDAVQPETALGTERILSAADHCFWHLDLGAAHRTAARRPCGLGACLLYRDLLDDEDSCGRVLLFARGLAQGKGICHRTCPTDPSVFTACRQLPWVIRLARMARAESLRRPGLTCSA